MKSSKKLVCISDLSEVEKAKVARLVEKLVSLGKANEQIQLELNNVKKKNEVECHTLRHEHISAILQKDEEIGNLTSKLSMSMGLLKLYQNKVLQYSEQLSKYSKTHLRSDEQVADLKEEVKRLDSLMQHQQFTISNTTQKLQDTEEMHSALIESSKLLETELSESKERLAELKAELKKTNQLLFKEIDNKNAEIDENKELQKLNKELENTLRSTMAVNEQQQLLLSQRGSSDNSNVHVASSVVLPPREFSVEPDVVEHSAVVRNGNNRVSNNQSYSVSPSTQSVGEKKRNISVIYESTDSVSPNVRRNVSDRNRPHSNPPTISRSVIESNKKKAFRNPPGKNEKPKKRSDRNSKAIHRTANATPALSKPLPWDEPVPDRPIASDGSLEPEANAYHLDTGSSAGAPLLNLSSEDEGSLGAIIASQRNSVDVECIDSQPLPTRVAAHPKVQRGKSAELKATRRRNSTNPSDTKKNNPVSKNNKTRESISSLSGSSNPLPHTSTSYLNQSKSFRDDMQPHRLVVSNSGLTRKSVKVDESIHADASAKDRKPIVNVKNISSKSSKSNLNSSIPLPYSRYDENRLLDLMSDMNI